MVTKEFIQAMHGVVARGNLGTKIINQLWFDDPIVLKVPETGLGSTVILDFLYTMASKVDVSIDGGATFFPFTNNLAVQGLQSIYLRFEGLELSSVAKAQVVLVGGVVERLIVQNRGFGYTSPPVVTIPDAGGGSGATAEAVLGTGNDADKVVFINVLTSGTGYGSVPVPTIAEPPGGDVTEITKEILVNFRGEVAADLIRCTLSEV